MAESNNFSRLHAEFIVMDQRGRTDSSLRRQAADALRRARKLPRGHDRNDLRQLAMSLLWFEKRGFVAIDEDGQSFLRASKKG